MTQLRGGVVYLKIYTKVPFIIQVSIYKTFIKSKLQG
jgi:hypothetical protein